MISVHVRIGRTSNVGCLTWKCSISREPVTNSTLLNCILYSRKPLSLQNNKLHIDIHSMLKVVFSYLLHRVGVNKGRFMVLFSHEFSSRRALILTSHHETDQIKVSVRMKLASSLFIMLLICVCDCSML